MPATSWRPRPEALAYPPVKDASSASHVRSRAPAGNVIPAGMNFAMPDELANTIAFLLCDLASGISGQALTVDRSLTTKFCGGGRLPRKGK